MKSNHILLQSLVFFFLSTFMMVSCGQREDAAGKTPAAESGARPQIDMTGPKIEITVLSVDAEAGKTRLEVTNRNDIPVRNIRGLLHMLDDEGNAVTFSNGNPKTSNFQQMKNPHLVDAKSKAVLVLNNKLDTRTATVSVELTSVEGTNGEELARD